MEHSTNSHLVHHICSMEEQRRVSMAVLAVASADQYLIY